jgi:excisionase family DNA binding protein
MKRLRAAYTTQEAAALLACHPETLRRAIRSGDLKAQGKRPYRVSAAELQSWWREQGGGELALPVLDDDLDRIRNPVDVGAAVEMARKLARGMRSLSALRSSMDLDALPELYDEADALEDAADRLEAA